jgi:hypothetical protein
MVNVKEETGDILANGLNLILEGQESIDSWVARFPQYKENLLPPLEAAQWLQVHSPVFNPLPEFVAVSRKSLVHQILFEQTLDRLSFDSNDPLRPDG